MALHKHHAFFGVDAAGQQKGRRLARLAAQCCGVLPHGDGVFVHHGIDAFIFVLQLGPVAHLSLIHILTATLFDDSELKAEYVLRLRNLVALDPCLLYTSRCV